jgi:hypothetical protein
MSLRTPASTHGAALTIHPGGQFCAATAIGGNLSLAGAMIGEWGNHFHVAIAPRGTARGISLRAVFESMPLRQ